MHADPAAIPALRIARLACAVSCPHVVRWKALSVSLALSLAVSGCVTSLGYYPDNLKYRQVSDSSDTVPKYETVKQWAYDVHDGFDTRATVNHYALEYGAVLGLAAAGTMAGLAFFSPGSAALQGIPIGTAFLSGTAAYYDNHFRYDMYARASAYVRSLIDVSDERVTTMKAAGKPLPAVAISIEASCLKEEVGRVISLVRRHIALSDPNTLVSELRSVNKTVDQNKLIDLVKAAQGDLSDLNVPANLPEIYCQGTGLPLPGPLEDPRLLIRTTQEALLSLSLSRFALSTAITDGQAAADRLKGQADGLSPTKPVTVVKPVRDKIDSLNKVLGEAKATQTNVAGIQAATAAGFIAELKAPNAPTATTIDTSSRLFEERERIKKADTEAASAAVKIGAAVTDAEAAIKAVQ